MARNLILGVLVAVAAFGCATSTSQKSSADSRAEKNSLQAAAAAKENCVRDTGSRIKRPDDRPCGAQPGSTYTQQQIESTGRIDTADALRQLDPRLQ